MVYLSSGLRAGARCEGVFLFLQLPDIMRGNKRDEMHPLNTLVKSGVLRCFVALTT